MNRAALAFLVALLALCAASCPTKPGDGELPGDDVVPPEAPVLGYRLDFKFEYIDKGTLIFWRQPDGRLNGSIAVAKGGDLLPGGTTFDGAGRVEDFSESGYRMVAMKFAGPATSGRCGSLPISYSLTLTYREPNGFLTGGLAAYCGENTFFGTPIQIFRLEGVLEPYTPPEK
jgi:hypothetical protein